MAAHHTSSTRGGLDKYYANMEIRWTKGRRTADESFLVTGMNIVASNTGPAFSPRDMQIVEIALAVAEIGQEG